MAVACLVLALPPPALAQVRDACAVVAAREGWRAILADVEARWGVTPGTVIAVLDQESRLRADARGQGAGGANPERNFGYAQANRRTWSWFLRHSGWIGSPSRTDFEASAHFVGWHFSHVGGRNRVGPSDIEANYLIYKQGEGGYRRGTPPSSRALAARVASAARRFDGQLASCAG
jgi:hypothetical protein